MASHSMAALLRRTAATAPRRAAAATMAHPQTAAARFAAPARRPQASWTRPRIAAVRGAHSIPRPPPPPPESSDSATSAASGDDDAAATGLAPSYELTFTCVPCGTRSAHRVSKQGYHHGSVLITCPSCRNRHIISDHLGIFGTQPGEARTLEAILAARGRLVKKGTLGEDGDVEFWEDGTSSSRQARQAEEGVLAAPERTGGGAAAGGAADDAPPGATFQTAKSKA